MKKENKKIFFIWGFCYLLILAVFLFLDKPKPLFAQANLLTPFFISPTAGPSAVPTPTLDPTQLLSISPTATSSAQVVESRMDIFLFTVLAFIYIMIIHFAINTGSEFVTFLIILGFVLGGVVGFWMGSWEAGLVVGIIFSFMFFGSPQKEI